MYDLTIKVPWKNYITNNIHTDAHNHLQNNDGKGILFFFFY